MPENPWAAPQRTPSPSPPIGLIIGAVAAVTLVLGLTIGILVILTVGDNGDDAAAPVAQDATEATTAATTATTTTATDHPDLPDGLDLTGWVGVPEARCAGDDQWVYAATNQATDVVVCRDGGDGDLYYRVLSHGNPLEITDGVTATDADAGQFHVEYPPSWIDIDGTTLTVHNPDGSAWGVEEFDRFWTASTD
ncbi:hypothetical protein [Corynebacterium terpenotabidum]|uniref:Uncharacterized protein n=1 Tax=Corynebacterium terpenotabidum Y-11 TaxID=1200352 RepID=S4XCD2_9CORY|nr:hypothetical protein [Corynebacterium terpenotabidum]AGP30782.1 hypothetical protein A606_05675 [Corynebacterium terpenotabidum Y-11]